MIATNGATDRAPAPIADGDRARASCRRRPRSPHPPRVRALCRLARPGAPAWASARRRAEFRPRPSQRLGRAGHRGGSRGLGCVVAGHPVSRAARRRLRHRGRAPDAANAIRRRSSMRSAAIRRRRGSPASTCGGHLHDLPHRRARLWHHRHRADRAGQRRRRRKRRPLSRARRDRRGDHRRHVADTAGAGGFSARWSARC